MGKSKVTMSPELSIGHSDEMNLYSARFRDLGLTAYGQTDKEARCELYDLLRTFIEHGIRYGTLNAQLTHSKVEWCIEPALDDEPAGFSILDEPEVEEEESGLKDFLREVYATQLVAVV